MLQVFWFSFLALLGSKYSTKNVDDGSVTESLFVTNITLISDWYRWNKFVFSKYGMTDEGFEVAWRLRRA